MKGNLTFRLLKGPEIDCRIATINEKGLTLLLYKDARVDQNILDETVGPMNWQRSHSRENANCTVSLWDDEKSQWVSKEDTGKESNTEAEKGLASDSFKRACFNWGIGRELYTAPFIWIAKGDANIVDSGRTDRNGKKIWTCYDKFKVSKIGYDSERNINELVITGKGGQIVYQMDSKKPEQPQALEQKYVNTLYMELKRTGIGLKSMLAKYGVQDVHDMTFGQWKDAMDILRTRPSLEQSTSPDGMNEEGLPWNDVK